MIGLDMEQLQILLLRRYNVLKDVKKLTDELWEVTSRNDPVSASLILDMRGEELGKVEKCREQIAFLAEQGREEAELIKRLVYTPLERMEKPVDAEERSIYELRQRTQTLLEEIRQKDRFLNQRVAGKKSFYRD